MRKLVLFSVLMLMVCSGEIMAQEAKIHGNGLLFTSEQHTYRLYYRWNEVDIDSSYLHNADNLRKIVDHLHSFPKIDSISIWSYASPEGIFEHNAKLARQRAVAARNFILSNCTEDNGLNRRKIILHPVPENWAGLREAVETGYHRWDREKVIEILDDMTISDATREWRLQQLDGGISWKWMRIHLMPKLRVATYVRVWGSMENVPAAAAEQLQRRGIASVVAVESPQQPIGMTHDSLVFNQAAANGSNTVQPRRTIAAVKTNLLYDAATAVNFAVEIPFGKHFSIQYEHLCPWWKGGPNGNKYCLQMLSMGGEARWWFLPKTREWYSPEVLSGKKRQRDALMGHFIGIYGDGGKFDIQVGRKFGLYQTHFWGAGLSYGYSLPVGKWANMEFSLSVGYMCIDYRKYTPAPDWSILIEDENGMGRMHWIGPTKAKVSLIVPVTVKTWRKRQ